jgi:hypothetical protein
MIAHRRSTLSILGLVASDASYYQEGSRNPGDLLRSLPDSEPRDEHGFPDSLWMSILWHGDPLIGTSSLTTEHGTNGALARFTPSCLLGPTVWPRMLPKGPPMTLRWPRTARSWRNSSKAWPSNDASPAFVDVRSRVAHCPLDLGEVSITLPAVADRVD